MTTKNKIVLGVVAIAILLLGLVIGTHAKNGLMGASGTGQTAPLHVTNSTNWDTGYFWGDLEVRQNTYLDGLATFNSSSIFNGSATFNSGVSFAGTPTFNAGFINLGIASFNNGAITFGTTSPVTMYGTSTLATTTISALTVTSCVGCNVSASAFGDFYGLTAGTGNGSGTDYAATIAVHTGAGTGRVPFPRLNTSFGSVATTTASGTAFTLPNIGVYRVTFKVHTTEPGELQLELNGTALPYTTTANMNPTAGGHLIMGTYYVTTVAPNATLAVINPAGNTPALTITPADGASTNAVAQNLLIEQVK